MDELGNRFINLDRENFQDECIKFTGIAVLDALQECVFDLGRSRVVGQDNGLTYTSRSALRAKRTPSNRRATHPVNAILNYAYGMLELRTHIQAIPDGYDPTRGIVHGDHASGQDTFVLDLMEPGRPVAERRVLELLGEHEFAKADFVVTSNGTCRLGRELARYVAS